MTDPQNIIIDNAMLYIDKRIAIKGWVHRTNEQGRALRFIILRDGFSNKYLQIVLAGPLAIMLHREASICVYGTIKKDLRDYHGREPRDAIELIADHIEIIGKSAESIENVLRYNSNPDILADQRHLVHRGTRASAILKGRDIIIRNLRKYFYSINCTEITPPCLVQTQVEGGSDLFSLDFFGTPAYLTQSSQLYLESVLPALNNVFCIVPSFRAEQSQTRRHLAEFTHCEAEYSFIDFDELLNRIDNMITETIEQTIKDLGDILTMLNPTFKKPQKPFMRMTYADAINYCNEHDILNEKTGMPFVYGEDISEKPERAMTDLIGTPIFMTRFPKKMKPFYMLPDPLDESLTLSVDLLYPNVGEIVGGSMRENNGDKLMKEMIAHGLNPDLYYWYTDQRKYGSVPHGGFGLGVERFCMAILGINHIRDICLYPRMMGRCKP